MITLALLFLAVGLYFHYTAGIPAVYEYSPNRFCIRSHSKYLDLQTYTCFGDTIWKPNSHTLMHRRCTSNNVNYVKGILHDL